MGELVTYLSIPSARLIGRETAQLDRQLSERIFNAVRIEVRRKQEGRYISWTSFTII